MAATKDQRKLLNRCVMNEIPVFVLTGTDQCALAALRAYAQEARRLGCNDDFIEDMEGNKRRYAFKEIQFKREQN